MQIGRVAALAGTLLAVAGCAIVDPRIAGGPEQGYCAPTSRAGRDAANLAAQPDRRTGWFGGLDCPPDFRPDYGVYGTSVGTAANFHYALHFLRDRRRRMEDQDRQLAQVNAVSRIVTLGGVGTAVGAAAYNANRSLLAGAVLASGAGYAIGTAFATPTMRDVLGAGVEALNCVESKAHSARTAAITDGSADPAARTRRDTRGRTSRPAAPQPGPGEPADDRSVEGLARTARTRVGELEAKINAVRGTLDREPEAGSPDAVLLTRARDAGQRASDAIHAVRTGAVTGPMIANAVYERTLAIVNAVNREMTRTTPNLNEVLAIARGAAGLAVNGLADTTQGLSAAISELRAVRTAGGQPAAAIAAAPAQPAGAGVVAPDAGTGNKPSEGPSPPTPAAPSRDAISASDAAALTRAAQDAAQAAADLLDALNRQGRAQSVLTQISACAFEHLEGGGTLAFSPQNPVAVKAGESVVVTVSGGRGPYRVTSTGTVVPGVQLSAELTTGPIGISTRASAAGRTASFHVEDVGNRAVAPQTLTVVAK